MATRREIVEAVLFIPAMLVLAALCYGLFAGLIHAGGWLFTTIAGLLSALPSPAARALAVLATAAIVAGAWTALTDGWRRRR